MRTTYLGLGSNLGRREEMLQAAIAELQAPDLRILRTSPVYETEPREMLQQPWFLNLVVEAETSLFPRMLVARTAGVERKLGRKRMVAKGPRIIDIDILLYGNAVVNTLELVIPHPRLAERRFVLAPLADLAPDLRHPVNRRTMRELLAATAGQGVRRVDWQPLIGHRTD
jgi:2-amino-4-hydroxy-6-hydroxymethyldihydropteridine diphosphokinase